MTASKSDVAGMKAMLAGVFAKAAEAKGKSARPPGAAPAGKAPAVPKRDPAVRLSLGPDAAEDAPARPCDPDLADRLEPAIHALARDLGRLLVAFGMDGGDAATVESALVTRFGDKERRAAVAALDGLAGELRPLAGDARQDAAVELNGIGLALAHAGGGVEVRLDDAVLLLSRVPAEETGEGLAAMLGVLRSAIRPGRGVTVETDRVAIDDLGRVMDALAAAMTAPPQGVEGTVTLTPLAAPADGGRMDLSLSLGCRLAETAVGAPPAAKPVPVAEKPVGDHKDGGFDVRI
ncbi:hypothetical protein [Azospirillum sp. B506]|uniref:hypothetical protein n=1 Tax=Azospirillum sp. B506 TaxID=137721 RepID=UPI000347408E|nr:hypothetical protein [Azospirillum sp. B506]